MKEQTEECDERAGEEALALQPFISLARRWQCNAILHLHLHLLPFYLKPDRKEITAELTFRDEAAI